MLNSNFQRLTETPVVLLSKGVRGEMRNEPNLGQQEDQFLTVCQNSDAGVLATRAGSSIPLGSQWNWVTAIRTPTFKGQGVFPRVEPA